MAKRRFHWSTVFDCVMQETDENGDTLVAYTHEPSQFGPLLSENRDGAESYHHYDALGSTTMLTDDAGDVTDTFTFDAWGNMIARTGTTPTPYTWVGRWGYQDDSATAGGFYIRARSYQSTFGRWTTIDPLLIFVVVDTYAYSDNQPVIAIDAAGMKATFPFPENDQGEWYIRYNVKGPTLLDNCLPDYSWVVKQNIKAPRPGPWNPEPTQTWQINTSTVEDALVVEDGECKRAQFEDQVKIDIYPIKRTKRHLFAYIEDHLKILKITLAGGKPLPDNVKICQLVEKVHKKLGLHDGTGADLPLKPPGRKPTDDEAKRMEGMRGPFLIMDTKYTYKNPCGKCSVCFKDEGGSCDAIPKCEESYEATVARGSTDDDFKTTHLIGPFPGEKGC